MLVYRGHYSVLVLLTAAYQSKLSHWPFSKVQNGKQMNGEKAYEQFELPGKKDVELPKEIWAV